MSVREQRVRERAYGFWAADGCQHGRSEAHWFRALAEEPLRVTFDTNALDKAARPERFPKDIKQPCYFEVHRALKAGRIKGYFCETLITLEGIEKKDRKKVLGGTRIESRSSSSRPDQITIDVRQFKKESHFTRKYRGLSFCAILLHNGHSFCHPGR